MNNKKIIVLKNTGILVLCFIVSTLLCFLLDLFKINDLNFIIIYILGILLCAVFTQGYSYSVILSIISVLGYNFFFTIPRYTFEFEDKSYIVTFLLMLIVGVGIATITYQVKRKMFQINELNLEKVKLKGEAEKEQMKATLLRSISHDLRTPLTTMKNGAEVLVENKISEEDKKEIAESIYQKADWTIRLVENLLSLSRIDDQKMTVRKTNEAIEEIIPQAVRNVSGVLGGRKIQYEMPEELILVPMDATLIIQTITNILGNAIKHTNDDGNITIKVWDAGRSIIFRISNDGEKIAKEDLPHIFEAYYIGGDRRGNSVGLGLSICKLIVTAHGGSITARNIEKGVVFEFNLPKED